MKKKFYATKSHCLPVYFHINCELKSSQIKLGFQYLKLHVPFSNSLFVGHPIAVSCAYSGRLAVAYRLLGPKVLPNNPKGKLLNMWVAIYECESTGSEPFLTLDV